MTNEKNPGLTVEQLITELQKYPSNLVVGLADMYGANLVAGAIRKAVPNSDGVVEDAVFLFPPGLYDMVLMDDSILENDEDSLLNDPDIASLVEDIQATQKDGDNFMVLIPEKSNGKTTKKD